MSRTGRVDGRTLAEAKRRRFLAGYARQARSLARAGKGELVEQLVTESWARAEQAALLGQLGLEEQGAHAALADALGLPCASPVQELGE